MMQMIRNWEEGRRRKGKQRDRGDWTCERLYSRCRCETGEHRGAGEEAGAVSSDLDPFNVLEIHVQAEILNILLDGCIMSFKRDSGLRLDHLGQPNGL